MSKILDLVNHGKVFEIDHKILGDKLMAIEEMKAIFNCFNAFWQYDGDPSPEKPHALLKSGKHSNGFIACKKVLKYPKMCKLFGNELTKHFLKKFPSTQVDVIVSSAYSAITLGYEVARRLSKIYPKIEYVEVEKDKDGNPTIVREGIDPAKTVLVINELMTTKDGSTFETRMAALNSNGADRPRPNVINDSFVLIHRSKDFRLSDDTIVHSIFHFDMMDYDVEKGEECPYCKAGSEAIKPKVGNNWKILHGRA